jgi:hypothetical protein
MNHKKAQANAVSNIIVGLVGVISGTIIFFLASPFLKDFLLENLSGLDPFTRFLILLMPVIIVLMLIVIFISVWRGGLGR